MFFRRTKSRHCAVSSDNLRAVSSAADISTRSRFLSLDDDDDESRDAKIVSIFFQERGLWSECWRCFEVKMMCGANACFRIDVILF